jgi:hypothetical protein
MPVGSFPCKYLGVHSRLKKDDFQPLVDAAAERLPTWKAGRPHVQGRLNNACQGNPFGDPNSHLYCGEGRTLSLSGHRSISSCISVSWH